MVIIKIGNAWNAHYLVKHVNQISQMAQNAWHALTENLIKKTKINVWINVTKGILETQQQCCVKSVLGLASIAQIQVNMHVLSVSLINI